MHYSLVAGLCHKMLSVCRHLSVSQVYCDKTGKAKITRLLEKSSCIFLLLTFIVYDLLHRVVR